jgi:hypothetical protein
MKKKMIFIPIFFIGMAAFVIWVLMLLWNWLMPDIFGLRLITFWESAGLLVMAKILFGGFHAGRKGCHKSGHHNGGWKQKFKKKWSSMSEEDKMKWQEKFGNLGSCETKPTVE